MAVCGRSGEPFTELTKLAQIRDKVRVSRLRLRLRLRLRFRFRLGLGLGMSTAHVPFVSDVWG